MSSFTNEDCMDLMARYPDKHFDLAIVDPPYGIGRDGQSEIKQDKGNFGSYRKYFEKKKWDIKPTINYFKELFRISINQIVFGANYFSNYLPPSMGWVYFNKGQAGLLTSSDGEFIFTSFNCAAREAIFNRCFLSKEGTIHPTQKPIALYKWLLSKHAKPGDLILDTHVGSASSLIACEDMGFEYVGCELDADYFKAASERIAIFKSQGKINFD